MSIRRRGPRSYQVRVGNLPAQTVPTRADAERLEIDLRRRVSMGELYEEPQRTLAEEITSLLARLRAGRPACDRTVEFNERSSRIWTRFGQRRMSTLRRSEIQDFIYARAAVHPRSAKNELEFLKRVLQEAKGRGQRIDPALFLIPPVKHRARRGRALNVSELYELAAWFPDHVKRVVLLAGQVGARQNVWFNLTDDLIDLPAKTLTVPTELAKNRREARVFLTDVEAKLLREQLLVRATGTRLVFPTITGKPWSRSGFRERVWAPAIRNASEQNSRFLGFRFHWLRHTAGSLMASLGMDPATAAERLGHTDGGALFLRTYRHLYEDERRRQADLFGARLQARLDEEWTTREPESDLPLNEADEDDGRTWDRTRDLPRVKRALSR
jgi:integrase